MPIYEYLCDNCKHSFEKLQKISDANILECPECGKNEAKRQVSAAGFRLKGSGWYETDFKSKPQTKNETKTKTEAKAAEK